MTSREQLKRQFSRMGARLKIQPSEPRQEESIRIDIRADEDGEFFDVRCPADVNPHVVDVQPGLRHLVLMFRDGRNKNKFLLGHDERHWFAAAVPGESVRDVRTAMESLRPHGARHPRAIRQGEWFFVPAPDAPESAGVIHRNEPLSRGAGSKPHLCEELLRIGGVAVMVANAYPTGLREAEYERLVATDQAARRMRWQRMVRDPEVYARGAVRHSDHKTVHLDGWHRVHMNRERDARHARQIAFLD